MSARTYGGEIIKKVATEVATGRTIVFPVMQAQEIRRLQISPFGVVEGKEKLRVTHNLTFGHQSTVRERKRAGRQELLFDPERRSVNADTYWQKILWFRLAGVMSKSLMQIIE